LSEAAARTSRPPLPFRATAPIYLPDAPASQSQRPVQEKSFMPTSRVDVTTAYASRYLQQLCKHWAHKFPVEFDPNHGTIDLSLGRTVLDADAAALHITVSTDEGGSLERLESVVADHIKRFAFREELIFDWKPAS
jgi:hypothetical protein